MGHLMQADNRVDVPTGEALVAALSGQRALDVDASHHPINVRVFSCCLFVTGRHRKVPTKAYREGKCVRRGKARRCTYARSHAPSCSSLAGTTGGPADAYELLTAREREVLEFLARGASYAEIADKLTISPRTAETHRTNLMRKLDLKTPADLTVYAVQRGLIDPDRS
jgi:DNA-binding CsgD family transcriptional regulator